LRDEYAETEIKQSWKADRLEITIEPATGKRAFIPSDRSYRLIFHGVRKPATVQVTLDGSDRQVEYRYGETTESLALDAIPVEPGSRAVITITSDEGSLLSKRDRTFERCKKFLHTFRLETHVKSNIDRELAHLIENPEALPIYRAGLKPSHYDALRNTLTKSA
jgi:hypothetical protein